MTTCPPIDVQTHLAFAKAIARGVRADYGFSAGSSEEEELEGAALLELVERSHAFDPDRVLPGQTADVQFQKFSGRAIRKQCQREAERLTNGGTFRTTRTPNAAPRVATDGAPRDTGAEERRRSTRAALKADPRPLPLGSDPAVSYLSTATGLEVAGEPDLPAWAGAVGSLVTQRRRSMWWLGDLVLWGRERFGADAADMLGALGYAGESVRVSAWVCRKFPTVRRLTALTFEHHQIAASLPTADARRLLRRCAQEGLSTRDAKKLRDEMRGQPERRQGGFPALRLLDGPKAEAAAQRYGLDLTIVRALLAELKGVA